MIKKTLSFLIIVLFFTPHYTFAQAGNDKLQENITNHFENYFKADREKIHLHLNKTTYLTEESVWFKGYIIEEKLKVPFLKTTNVYVDLFDGNSNKIATQLCYTQNSVLQGYINLPAGLPSGSYYIRVYTNFMNNFKEDESSVYAITVLNPTDTDYKNRNTIDYNNVSASFYPESGVFLENSSNTIAVRITDCNGKGIAVKNAAVKDAKGTVVTNFSTNAFGIGKFDLLQTTSQLYKAVTTINNKEMIFNLPPAAPAGTSFTVNNYTFSDKTIIKIKTNTPTLTDMPLLLIIQQDDAVSFIDLVLKKNTREDTFSINSDHFNEGINNLILTDKNAVKLAERMIFKPYNIKKELDLSVTKTRKDSIHITGKSNIVLGSLSISVLPEKTIAANDSKSIYDAFIFSPYTDTDTKDAAYYLNNFTKNKHYELDTYLITQKPKYDLSTILTTKPENKFEFETGIAIKGTINKELTDRNNYLVEMSSLYYKITEESKINEKNEFYFKNLIVADSTVMHFSLFNNSGKRQELKMYPQVIKNNTAFLKPLRKPVLQCPENATAGSGTPDKTEELPYFTKMKMIHLDSVSVKAKKKEPKLNHNRKFSNNMAREFKISEGDFASYREVLPFIGAHGYDVGYINGSVYISGRIRKSLRGGASPAVFIDDIPVTDLNQLQGMSLEFVDEIYLNRHGFGMGSDGANGTIRIYTKKVLNPGASAIRVKSQQFLITNGFQAPKSFKNPGYSDYNSPGFYNYGTIYWLPEVETDEDGAFRFSIPNYSQQSVKLKIEGIGTNGELISEEKTIAF